MNSNVNISNSNTSTEISLKDLINNTIRLFKYILHKWKKIFPFVLLGCVLGYLYAYKREVTYTARTSFVIEEGDKSGGGLLGQFSGLASLAGVETSAGGIFQGDNLLELYKSRIMVQKALLTYVKHNGKPILLINRYAAINKLDEKWGTDPRLRNVNFDVDHNFTRAQDSILGTAVDDINKNYLSVSKRDKKLSIIDVDVKATDETFAKDFNDAIVRTVNNFYVQTKAKKALQNYMILQHQTDSVRTVLSGAIYQSASVADATPNLNLTRQILRVPAQRSQFNAEANKAILTQLVQNLELAKITLRKETPLLQVIDEPIYPLQKTKLSKLLTALAVGALFGFLTVLVIVLRKVYSSVLQ